MSSRSRSPRRSSRRNSRSRSRSRSSRRRRRRSRTRSRSPRRYTNERRRRRSSRSRSPRSYRRDRNSRSRSPPKELNPESQARLQKQNLIMASTGDDAFRRRLAMSRGQKNVSYNNNNNNNNYNSTYRSNPGVCFDFQRGNCTRESCRFSHEGGGSGNGNGMRTDLRSYSEPVPELYSIHHGRVVRVQPYGCFVELPGFRKHGLVHISQLSDRRVEDCHDVLGKNAEGSEVWVKVMSLENNKLSLSMKDVSQSTGRDLDKYHDNAKALSQNHSSSSNSSSSADSQDAPPVYSVKQGTVTKIMPFGAFISFPGFRKHGLCHISQLVDYKVSSVDDVVDVNQIIWVKVLPEQEEGKISLSMKLVNQDSGQDLDPSNERANENNGRRGGGDWKPKDRIVLEAIVNADCGRCGAHGHTTRDCMAPEGVRYDDNDLYNDEPAQEVTTSLPISKQSKKGKHQVNSIEQALKILADARLKKKKKKDKKKEKKKEKKTLKKLKKKLKKQKKKKKSKHSKHGSSESDSTSESSDSGSD